MKKGFTFLLIILLVCITNSTNKIYKDLKNGINKCLLPSKLICNKDGICKCIPFLNHKIKNRNNYKIPEGIVRRVLFYDIKKNCFRIGHSYECKKRINK